jgi:hypothetical protein
MHNECFNVVVWSNEAVALGTSKSRSVRSQLLKEEPLYIKHSILEQYNSEWTFSLDIESFSSYCERFGCP